MSLFSYLHCVAEAVYLAFVALAIVAGCCLLLIGLLFMAAHVHDTWDAPPPLHSGARPECPSWDDPATDF